MYQNPIWINGRIDLTDFFQRFTTRFSEIMTSTKEDDEMTVYINSRGGDAETALGVYNLLLSSRRNTIGIVVGSAQSSASLVLQACKRRLITPDSTLLLHRSRLESSGTVESVQAFVDKMRSIERQYYQIYAERSGGGEGYFASMAHRDVHFTAQAALEARLVDEILT